MHVKMKNKTMEKYIIKNLDGLILLAVYAVCFIVLICFVINYIKIEIHYDTKSKKENLE